MVYKKKKKTFKKKKTKKKKKKYKIEKKSQLLLVDFLQCHKIMTILKLRISDIENL